MFPAKYSFDINATPIASCATDFVVYGLNVAGGGGQSNLIGITNLYSGAADSAALNPTVNWAYNGSTSRRGDPDFHQ